MAIQVRRGNESDFDASKMLPGEWAVSLDTRYVRMCFAPGIVLRMSTYDAFEADMAQIQAILAECRSIQSAVQRIQTEVNSKASLTVEYANDAKESADRAYSEAERAKTYADNAEAVTNVQIATKDRAGLIKGGNNHIAEDGTLMLITETTSTTQPNSHAGREMVLEIGGVTEQDSTTGNQLFDASAVKVELGGLNVNGANYTTEGFIRTGVIPANGDITIVCDLPIYRVCWYATEYISGVLRSEGVNQLTVSLPTEATRIRVAFINTNTLTDANIETVKDTLMLNKGTTALPYEQYTGGQPAPNPSYPMPIKNSKVKGIRTHHKNFFGFGKNTTDLTNELRPNSKQRLTFSSIDDNPNRVKCNFTGGGYSIGYIAIYGVDGTKDWVISFNVESNTTEYIPVVTKSEEYSDKEHIILKFGGGNSGTNVDSSQYFVLSNFQVEEGTEATEFEAYQGTEIAFSQPIDLYGMGGVQDLITAQPINRGFAKRVFDGSESWLASSTQGKYYVNEVGGKEYGVGLCSHAKMVSNYSDNTNECYFSANGRFVICTSFATVDEWKAHLASKPMEVVYELATPTTEALPIADQIGLNSLATYDGITYVEFIYEGLEPTFKGKYGTSEVGGYTLESLLTARNNELKQELANERLSALEASVVNNI